MTSRDHLPEDDQALASERTELLERVAGWLEVPMIVLGFVWLVLLGIELLWEQVWRRHTFLESLSIAIWIAFIVNFAVEVVLAPRKRDYFRTHWLTVVSLAVPALRVFRIFRAMRVLRAARAARGMRLVRVVGSINRGMRALGASMGRRGFGYVVALTVIVTFTGAAGMYAFENDRPGGLRSYPEALWWTAMIMTTMGSAYWPQSPEGRVLCVFLALYAFGIFGYVTAALATFFVGRDADSEEAGVAGAGALRELRAEIAALRKELAGPGGNSSPRAGARDGPA